MAFSFAFSGDDIDAATQRELELTSPPATTTTTTSAFPVAGKPQLPPTNHPLADLLARLPSKIAYDFVDLTLDDGSPLRIPRRELWDVRVQLMAEDGDDDDGRAAEGLGEHDVKTGVYEGGFKSWESSVDLVKVLASQSHPSTLQQRSPVRSIELGCGTALPSLALFQWALALDATPPPQPFTFILADYNPSVLQLVTMPNFLLAWALHHHHRHHHRHPALHDAFSADGELEITPELLQAFQESLRERNMTLAFLSGGWSQGFVELLYGLPDSSAQDRSPAPGVTLLLGAETIYSPFALEAFNETMFAILRREQAVSAVHATAFVAAKRLYFGVGGSLDDFVDKARAKGATVVKLREEVDGVARGVVRCELPTVASDQHMTDG
ncbi:Protein-histidine N-methyltransferase [Purpureocillium takamizusanense]|uniref:protein-histidine N-methyltransferase n=1 Tax=Purpureocillium takamizusanense TaxID=2060973 RepID=A0A9Q8Q9X1_9HYPO|nr:Protein-histidine N-methyltransferase [Purpureocillium takamizusanense]UNI15268.1 Protein-histidine N-methyltransferase [Purpureocillium takamizusanense]